MPRIRLLEPLYAIIPKIIGTTQKRLVIEDINVENSERRLHPRVRINARCWLEQESLTLYGTVANISQGGLFLCTPVHLPVGNDVQLTLDLASGRVTARGEVVRSQSAGCDCGQTGLGIYFREINTGQTGLHRSLKQKTVRRTG